MSAEEPGPAVASCYIEPLMLSAWLRDEDEEENDKEVDAGKEPKSPQRGSSDESEESEPEPLLASAVRRKVSFADAFGLDLVSVKEFDSRVETAEGLERLLGREAREGEEYYLSCIFSVPASDEELELRLRQNKLDLESIELLPGSTTIRGTVRALNLSYHKVIYVHTTLDGWQSHFDLLAEYVPGSSDGETDRFSFQLTLVPPFSTNGTRVEFCLRYESSTGTFWANNRGMNYVLFCHQRGGRALKEKEDGKEREAEENSQKGKKSCLKAFRKGSCAESKPMGVSSELSEPESSRSVEREEGKTQHQAESRSREALEESCKALAERRNRRWAAQLARMQDYFSHSETEAQLGHPSHRERGLNAVLPMPHLSIPVSMDTSSTLLVSSRKEQNGNTPPILTDHLIPLLSLDWGKHTTSPSHPHTSEITSGTSPEKQLTEDASTESSNDAWEAFLNGTVSSDNHTNALDQECLQQSITEYDMSNTGEKVQSAWRATKITQEGPLTSGNELPQFFTAEETLLESDPAKLLHVLNPSCAKEVLGCKYAEKTRISSETHTVPESKSALVLWRSEGPGVSEAPHDRHAPGERSFSVDEFLTLANPRDTVQTMDGTEPQNSKAGDGASLEECAASPASLGTEKEVKREAHRAVGNTLTFTEFRDKPSTDRHIESGGSLERQHTDEWGEPKQTKEHMGEENANEARMKWTSWSEYFEEAAVVLKSRRHEDEEPSHVKDRNTEICISTSASMVCNEEEPHKRTECLDRSALKSQGQEEAVCYKSVKEGLSESSERQRGEKASVEANKNIADRECEKHSKDEGQKDSCIAIEVIYERQSEGEDYIDSFPGKEPDKPQSFPKTCPQTSITSHTSDLFEHFTWTESVSEGELFLFPAPHKSFESDVTLRHRAAQERQELDVEAEIPASFSKTASPSMPSWLLVCWAKICSLSHVTGALVYAILFVIFITTYLHDFPVCLAIYLLSVCWWCTHGMKKRVTTADSQQQKCVFH